MKKTKLLTGIAALALVLGLGACTTTENETPTESGTDTTTDEETETTSDTDSDTKDATIENYTLSFTFTLEEQPATLENYESLYIAGDFNEWALEELTENEGAYEFVVPSITVGEHSYKVLLAYTGSPNWDNEIIPANEDNTNATFTVVEGDTGYTLEWELTKAFGEYLQEVTSRTDCTIYFHFTNEEHTETYSIPSYADGYVTGYFTTGTWTDYVIGSTGKLTAQEDGTYSYTFSEIAIGTITYNIYFEYNSSAVNHSAATSATWEKGHAISSNNTTMVIPATGEVHIDIDVNPADVISDSDEKCSLTIALKDSGSTSGKTFSISFSDWTVRTMLSSSNSDYDVYYTNSVDKNVACTFTVFTDTTNWSDKLQPPTGNSSFTISDYNIILAASETNYDVTTITFTVDFASFGQNSRVTASSVSITH